MKLKRIIFILLFVCTAAFGQFNSASPSHIVIVEEFLPDGSIIIRVNGKRMRAFHEQQIKGIFQTQQERNMFRDGYFECQSRLFRRNEGE
jgi:hypothetical protein